MLKLYAAETHIGVHQTMSTAFHYAAFWLLLGCAKKKNPQIPITSKSFQYQSRIIALKECCVIHQQKFHL